MDIQPLDLVRWGLLLGGLVLQTFVLGAYVGWRLAAPASTRLEATWLFWLGELVPLTLIVALILSPLPAPLGWATWLPLLALWAITLGFRIRGRRATA